MTITLARAERGSAHPAWSRVWAEGRRTEVLTLGQGTPVTFLHGWGVSPRAYLPSLTALAHHGLRVTAPSLPGFGHSDPLRLRDQNVPGVASHVAGVLDTLAQDAPRDVVAHSFGGGVAIRLAATRPDLVASLTLICPVGGAGEGAVPLRRIAVGALADVRHRWVARALRDFGRAATHSPAAVVATALAAWQADLLDDVAEVGRGRVPVRFLFADRDAVVTPGAIPLSTFEAVTCEVVRGHHNWLISEPHRFAAAVAHHLRRPPVPAAA